MEMAELVHSLARKIGHMLEFAGLYGGYRYAGCNRGWAVSLAIMYAMTDEYHQTFVPTRAGTWADVAIDGCGVVLAVWAEHSWSVRNKQVS